MRAPFLMLAVVSLLGTSLPTRAQDTPPAHDESQWFRNARQLTSLEMGLDRSGEAYFAADGKRISFQAYPKGKSEYQIYVMNLDGSGLKMVSTGEGATTCSFWHPSGQKLIFASNHLDQRPAVSGIPPRSHTGGEAEPASRPATAATSGHPGGGHPGATQPAGSQPTTGPAHGGGGPRGYAWTYFPGMDVFEYTFATGTLRRLTDTDGYDAECSYSPDGRSIVFSSFRDGAQEIYISDADGQHARRITHKGGANGGPFFSPDGKRICYRSDRIGEGNLQIFINNTDGTD